LIKNIPAAVVTDPRFRWDQHGQVTGVNSASQRILRKPLDDEGIRGKYAQFLPADIFIC